MTVNENWIQLLTTINSFLSKPIYKIIGMEEPLISTPWTDHLTLGMLMAAIALVSVLEKRRRIKKEYKDFRMEFNKIA